MTALIIIGGILGYFFAAGSLHSLLSRSDETDEDRGFSMLFSLTWPVSIPLAVAAVSIFLAFMGPSLLGESIADRRRIKASRAAEAAQELAKVQSENARLERELGIGGDR